MSARDAGALCAAARGRDSRLGSSNLSWAPSSPRSCSAATHCRSRVAGRRRRDVPPAAGRARRGLTDASECRSAWIGCGGLRTGSPTCVRASQVPAGPRARAVDELAAAPRRLRDSPACPTASADTTPVECHLGCAGSADRGVPTRTRHHNDGNRGRLDPRRREIPGIHWARARPMRRAGYFPGPRP